MEAKHHRLRSPSWRIGLRGCKNLPRLQVGDTGVLQVTTNHLVGLVREAGFDVIGVKPWEYSDQSEHGYTLSLDGEPRLREPRHKLAIAIGQSSIEFHCYPESHWVTVDLVTCGDYNYCRKSARKLVRLLEEFYASSAIDFVQSVTLRSDGPPTRR